MPVYIVFVYSYPVESPECFQARPTVYWAGTEPLGAQSKYNEAIDDKQPGEWVECWLYIGKDREEVFFTD